MSKSALLICNGEPPSRALARRLVSEVDLIVAADGGADVARRLGIYPHVIIGDLDSITESTKRFFALGPTRLPRFQGREYSHTQIVQVDRQDNTDL